MALILDKMVINLMFSSVLSSKNIIGKHIYVPTLRIMNHYQQLLHKTYTQYGLINLVIYSLI